MIYPDINYKVWAKRYNISIKPNKCLNCKKEFVPTIPIATKHYKGLITKKTWLPR